MTAPLKPAPAHTCRCGHGRSRHTLEGCTVLVGAFTCPCQAFTPEPVDPVKPRDLVASCPDCGGRMASGKPRCALCQRYHDTFGTEAVETS
jgi:hypothetical protein